MKKVSILMPLFNAEKYLAETLECCLAQTYSNIEIIIVDDGSTDGSLSIAQKYEKKDSRIHVYSQPNKGGCRARNVAFEKSSGDYIKYLDADDLMSCDLIEKQVALLENINDPYAVSVCAWEDFYKELPKEYSCRFLYRNYESGLDLIEDAWFNGDWYVVTCYLTSRKLIREAGGWNEQLTKVQDGEFFCRVLSKTSKIVFCSDSYFYYRKGHISVSSAHKFSEGKLDSSLLGRISCKNTVLPLRNNSRIQYGLSRIFSEVMLNSPYGSKWYIEARDNILSVGGKPIHPSPNKKSKFILRFITFEKLMRIKSFLIKIGIKK